MAFDEGPGPEPVKTRSEYEQGVVGLVDKTLGLWARKLPQYLVMVGLTGVAITILQALVLIGMFGLLGLSLIDLLSSSPIDVVFSLVLGVASPTYMVILLLLSIVGIIVYAVVAGGAIHYTIIEYENPGNGDVRESFSFAFGRVGSLIGVQILQSLIVGGLAILSVFIMMFDLLIGFAMIFLILYVAVKLAPAIAIVVAEDRPAVASISRSWQITGGLFWHVFLAQLLIGIVILVINAVLAIGLGMFLPFIFPDYVLIVFLVSLISTLLVSSINYIYLAVLYKDLEARGTSGQYDWWQ